MRTLLLLIGTAAALLLAGRPAVAADTKATNLVTKGTYKEHYGVTGKEPTVDAAKDLPRFPAVEPKDAIATFKIKKGFKLEFAAHEPQVADPIALSFDERGRMFVVEMIDYSERRDEQPHLGRIRMLEDKDGDGYFETSTIFADNLAWPTAVICYGGGIFVGATPDIIWLKDTKGTGKADVREVVFTGFGTALPKLNVQGLMNSFNWGLDNRIHLQSGPGNRGEIKNLRRPDLKPIELAARDFWFDPRTFEFGTEAGGGQYGFSYDTRGRKFVCSNSDHLQMFLYDDRYAARNPSYSMPPPRRSIAADGGAAEVYRISPDEPWRIMRTRWRVSGAVKGAVEGGGRVSGYFTGATGTTVYRGDAYGPEFVNNTFTGDAGGGLMHRKILYPDGVGLIGKRPDDEQNFEFLASRDTWCRLVNFANAPDGCLYALDMYREVIEHPWSIPEEIKKHLDLNSGNDRGRIYRVAPENFQRRPKFDLGKATTAELVATLEHPNGWHRDTAARLLSERQDKGAVAPLHKLLYEEPDYVKTLAQTPGLEWRKALPEGGYFPAGKIHLLYALDGLGALTPHDTVAAAYWDPALTEHAVKLMERWLKPGNESEEALEALPGIAVFAGRDPRALFQVALSAGETKKPAGVTALEYVWGSLSTVGEIAARKASEGRGVSPSWLPSSQPNAESERVADSTVQWVQDALLNSIGDRAAEFHARFRESHIADEYMRYKQRVFIELARMIGAKRQADEVSALMEYLAKMSDTEKGLRDASLIALGEGLTRGGSSLAKADTGGKLNAIHEKAFAAVPNRNLPAAERVEAVNLLLLTTKGWEKMAVLSAVLSAEEKAEEVQLAAVRAFAKLPSSADNLLLHDVLACLSRVSPRVRSEALSTLLARPERAMALLHAIESGSVKREQLNATQIEALQHHKNTAVASLAAKVLPMEKKISRDELIQQFSAALTLKGDAAKGRTIYAERCISCHRAEGQGFQLGPDFVTVKTAGREKLLTSLLDPNREVAPQYLAFNIETKDGESYAGLIVADNAAGVTLRQAFGKEDVIPRAKIKTMRSPGQSLMPEDLQAGLTSQQLADLLEFIENVK
ncbi:MAG: c-type cytochrome [Verrucomicrobia bacterium]|nr:c-type cytochrome [Verrucomicrobiota bacterium]